MSTGNNFAAFDNNNGASASGNINVRFMLPSSTSPSALSLRAGSTVGDFRRQQGIAATGFNVAVRRVTRDANGAVTATNTENGAADTYALQEGDQLVVSPAKITGNQG